MAKLNMELFDKADKKRLLDELSLYGIKKLPYLIVKWGKRLRIFSGNISRNDILALFRELNVDSIGLYFTSLEGGIRLSLDAAQLLSKQIDKEILDITDFQTEQWFKGKNIELSEQQKKEVEKFEDKYFILRNGDDITGVGKKSFNSIANFMPKERRIKQ